MLMEYYSAGLLRERATDVVGETSVAEDNLLVFDPLYDRELF